MLSVEDSREDVLLGVIVHNKVLGRSRHHRHHHHHHHRHKRTHPPHHHSSEKRSKLEVGIGNVTPPESPKKLSAAAPPTVTSSVVTTAVTPTVTSIPSVYGSGENEVTSTSITHFSAGIKDDVTASSDVAYSPSDEVEKAIASPAAVAGEEFIAPLSPNTMSRLQSLIQTVKDSIASLPSAAEGAAVKQDVLSSSTTQSLTVEEKNDITTTATTSTDTSSAYVFHESLPTTTSVAMTTNLQQQIPSTRQHPSFYGNQEFYNPPMYGSKRSEPQFDNHHGYQSQREQWIPYRSNWSPQQR